MSDAARSAAFGMKACLAGIRVVDFSWVVAGPMATKRLGAMGAEIIKIESTTRPEFSFRQAWFAIINNNKRSCTLNITFTPSAAGARGASLLVDGLYDEEGFVNLGGTGTN